MVNAGEGTARRVVVTGGSGFIGTNVVEGFLRDGSRVLNLDVAPPRNPAHREWWTPVDVMDAEGVERAFRAFAPDVLIHLAARTELTERHGLGHYAANIDGVANVIRAVIATGTVERSLFASSRLVCDLGYEPRHDRDYHPSTLYGQSKAAGEELVREAPPELGTWTILRPMGIWGPWFGVPYNELFRLIGRGVYVHPGRRDVRKAYGYVENTVHQIRRLVDAPTADVHARTFWLADYPPIVVRTWAETIRRSLGARPIATVPVPVLKAAGIAGDVAGRLGVRLPLSSFRVNNMVTDMLCDTRPLEAIVGPLPYSPEAGVERTVAWLRSTASSSMAAAGRTSEV